ncbi:HAMP domain-containing sensor histidine kinase [Haloarcula rubra]|uniref:sensor histidine kinase n=1 Tax=Haloarcula rubra TaxID=2487747 RepID=UPI002E29DA87|nr:HAMP domain-containing sensor histidine kinase [Halomicroarcula rubra]
MVRFCLSDGLVQQLLSIGNRIRDFQRVQDRAPTISTVDLVALVEHVTNSVNEKYPAARLDVESDVDEPALETDKESLELALRNLLENAIVHNGTEDPLVEMRVFETGDHQIVFEVRDRNDRIPQMEIETLEAGEESALQHGQGIGLWIVTWCLEYIDGELRFAYDEGNVVTVTLPRGDSPQDSDA